MKKSSMAAIAAALTLCSTASHAAWSTGSFGGLNAQIYTPSSAASGRALFVALHGCAQENTDLKVAKWQEMADQYNAVVVLPNAKNRVIARCWNYGNPSIDMGDYNAVIKGTNDFIGDSRYGIDRNQVYVTGLSSGATFAAALACGNPDLFAGIGSGSGPTIGSNQMNAMSGETPSVSQAVNWCKTKAGGKASHYKTQLYAQSYGAANPANGDGILGAGFIKPNREVQLQLYGLTGGADYSKDIPYTLTAGHTTVNETEYSVKDNFGAKRVSMILIPNMGHAYPGGVNGSYVKQDFNFPKWMAANFKENNCRMAENQGKPICGTPPEEVQNLVCTVTKTSVNLTWSKPGVAVDGYKVANVTDGQEVKTAATSHQWTNLTTGKKYTFSVAATNGSTTYKAKQIDCTPAGISPVTGLTATPSSTSVALSWKGVAAAAKYTITRNGSALTASMGTSITDANLAADTAYRYCVKAVDAAGEASGETCVDTRTKPAQCWKQSETNTCTMHYVGKRLSLQQYLACGSKTGYIKSVTLYGFGTPTQWSNKADCSPIGF